MLRRIDEYEKLGKPFDLHVGDRAVTPEEGAESLIAECSDDLARVWAIGPPLATTVGEGWAVNLRYMQWWLQNRRERHLKR